MLKRGSRIALRAKVNDASISGLTIVDSILPVGRGQRQLILGDRYTGKTSISPALVIIANRFNFSGSIDASGSKRSFCIYVGINQNPSKLAKLIDLIRIDRFSLVIATHAPTSAPPSLIAPLLGRAIAERLRNKGADIALRFDDPSKHPKSYRQTASIQAKIPSRDAFPTLAIFITGSVGSSSNYYCIRNQPNFNETHFVFIAVRIPMPNASLCFPIIRARHS